MPITRALEGCSERFLLIRVDEVNLSRCYVSLSGPLGRVLWEFRVNAWRIAKVPLSDQSSDLVFADIQTECSQGKAAAKESEVKDGTRLFERPTRQ